MRAGEARASHHRGVSLGRLPALSPAGDVSRMVRGRRSLPLEIPTRVRQAPVRPDSMRPADAMDGALRAA